MAWGNLDDQIRDQTWYIDVSVHVETLDSHGFGVRLVFICQLIMSIRDLCVFMSAQNIWGLWNNASHFHCGD